MLKKRGELTHAPRNGRLRCSRLDTASEALPSAHAMRVSEEASTVNYELNCPAWYKSYDEVC